MEMKFPSGAGTTPKGVNPYPNLYYRGRSPGIPSHTYQGTGGGPSSPALNPKGGGLSPHSPRHRLDTPRPCGHEVLDRRVTGCTPPPPSLQPQPQPPTGTQPPPPPHWGEGEAFGHQPYPPPQAMVQGRAHPVGEYSLWYHLPHRVSQPLGSWIPRYLLLK